MNNSICQCQAVQLKCENVCNPIGIGTPYPHFSWNFGQKGRNCLQSAYQLIVSDCKQMIEKCIGNVWDTGMIPSNRTYFITYAGVDLCSRTRYFWRVRAWDADGKPGVISETAEFETGFLSAADWKAKWIGGFDLLRYEINVSGLVASARAYMTGRGYYELYLNGVKVSDQILAPSYTDFDKRLEYTVHDVTSCMTEGRNALAIMLGQGILVTDKKALFQLEIKLKSGETVTVISDEKWKGSAGPLLEDHIYNGERYDASQTKTGWDSPGYDDSGWRPVMRYDDYSPALVPQSLPPIRIVEEIKPKSIVRKSDDVFIVDFGINLAGFVRLRVHGLRGTRITLRFAEILGSDGTVDQRNLLTAKATDTYVLKGDGVEAYQPRFTYHGFRFVQVEGYPGVPEPGSFIACKVRSDVRQTGTFHCSNTLLNSIHDIMKRTLSNNLHSIPTDCCQRDERKGWMADAHVASEACIFNFDMHFFYRKWLDDISDIQDAKTGALEYTQAPGWFKEHSMPWNVAYPIMVHRLCEYYDDLDIVSKHYENLRSYFAYLGSLEIDGLLPVKKDYGDWLSIKYTRPHQVDNCLYYLFTKIMSNLAARLNKEVDAGAYLDKSEVIKELFNKKYLNKEWGNYNSLNDISQLGNLLPLHLGMVPAECRDLVQNNFLWDLERARGSAQMTTGIIGTKYLMEYLTAIGNKELIYELLCRTEYPSYGFMLKNGATTVWERWEYMVGREMNSHDHPALASPDTLFWRVIAGIAWPREEAGIRTFEFDPYFHPDLGDAEGALDTPWGQASIQWQQNAAGVHVKVSVPPNTRGRLRLAKNGCEIAGIPAGIQIEQTVSATTVQLGSGEYEIFLTKMKSEG